MSTEPCTNADCPSRLGFPHTHVATTPDHRLRDALRAHHPIMRSETGPFSGCRCGQVKLGQDVIAHVVSHLHRALEAATGQP